MAPELRYVLFLRLVALAYNLPRVQRASVGRAACLSTKRREKHQAFPLFRTHTQRSQVSEGGCTSSLGAHIGQVHLPHKGNQQRHKGSWII